jgi:hypothetical protein
MTAFHAKLVCPKEIDPHPAGMGQADEFRKN